MPFVTILKNGDVGGLVEAYVAALREQGFNFSDTKRTGHSRTKLLHYIPLIGLSRFDEFAHPFRPLVANGERVGVDHILRLYRFDRHLRLLTLDAVERIEISLKGLLEPELLAVHGEKWHLNQDMLNKVAPDLYENIRNELYRTPIMSSLKGEGKSYADFPANRVLDSLSFGRVELLLRTLPPSPTGPLSRIAGRFDLLNPIFTSWIKASRTVRNTAAHHSRLWNRRLQAKPIIPPGIKELIGEVREDFVERYYGAAVVLAYFVGKVGRNSQWKLRLRHLVEENNVGYLDIKATMGFPEDWWETDFWK